APAPGLDLLGRLGRLASSGGPLTPARAGASPAGIVGRGRRRGNGFSGRGGRLRGRRRRQCVAQLRKYLLQHVERFPPGFPKRRVLQSSISARPNNTLPVPEKRGAGTTLELSGT